MRSANVLPHVAIGSARGNLLRPVLTGHGYNVIHVGPDLLRLHLDRRAARRDRTGLGRNPSSVDSAGVAGECGNLSERWPGGVSNGSIVALVV